MQKLYLPGLPWVDLSEMPGSIWKTLRRISRTARPIVELARLPGPNRFTSALRSMSAPQRFSCGCNADFAGIGPAHDQQGPGAAGAGGRAVEVELRLVHRLE